MVCCRGGQKISRVSNSAPANINCSRMIPQLIARYRQAYLCRHATLRMGATALPFGENGVRACYGGKTDRMSGLVKSLGQLIFGRDIAL